jgi:high affinity choline transporter 7
MGIAAIIGLYAIFLVVGWWAARKVKEGSVADMLVAGRMMPLWLATLTMTATWVDGGYLLGTAEGVYRNSIPSGLQGGVCFGLSLILGGICFARRMRELEFTTLIDPFEVRFGKRWAAVLFLPAIAGELFWSAELLVAIGSTFGAVLGMKLVTAIILSALVVVLYTMIGGMWSVAYTDALQLGLVVVGLLAALPFALNAVGGLEAAWTGYLAARPERGGLMPPLTVNQYWTLPTLVSWWDVSAMLICGGVPWNCYFQRVLACQTPRRAQWHSLLAGALTIALTIPPLLFGIAAFRYPWSEALRAQLDAQPSMALPLLLVQVAPPIILFLGIGAIIGAVTSSFSSSILSAAAMISWNGIRRLLLPDLTAKQLKRLIQIVIVLLGAVAVVFALKVQSVQALWFFTSDLVFVLLFPQLICALYDPKANRTGSIAAFCVSLILRLGGGEPLLGLPYFIPYHEIWAAMAGPNLDDAARWYDAATGTMLLPFKTLAAAIGLILLPLISRLTAHRDRPRPLGPLPADQR